MVTKRGAETAVLVPVCSGLPFPHLARPFRGPDAAAGKVGGSHEPNGLWARADSPREGPIDWRHAIGKRRPDHARSGMRQQFLTRDRHRDS